MSGSLATAPQLQKYRRRAAAHQRGLRSQTLLLRGSVFQRYQPCGKGGCRCQARPPALHGPYYAWTRKVRGKTITVWLPKEAGVILSEWVDESRQWDRLVTEMERVAVEAAEWVVSQARATRRKKGR